MQTDSGSMEEGLGVAGERTRGGSPSWGSCVPRVLQGPDPGQEWRAGGAVLLLQTPTHLGSRAAGAAPGQPALSQA